MIEDQGLSIQFNALLRKPLSDVLKISSMHTSYPSHRVIVINALDECYDPQSLSSYLAEIVALIPWLKVIITSRPLDDIEGNLCIAGYMMLRLHLTRRYIGLHHFFLSFSPPSHRSLCTIRSRGLSMYDTILWLVYVRYDLVARLCTIRSCGSSMYNTISWLVHI